MQLRSKEKIKLIEATKSSLFALIIGAREAIAVPPHIAVPDTNKRVRFLGSLINFPIKIPNYHNRDDINRNQRNIV